MEQTTKTWNAETKTKWIECAKEHAACGGFVKNHWLDNSTHTSKGFAGSVFGAMLQEKEDVMLAASVKMQIPIWLVGFIETIFDMTNDSKSVDFAIAALESIPCDTFLGTPYRKFLRLIYTDPEKGTMSFLSDAKAKQTASKLIDSLESVFITGDNEELREDCQFTVADTYIKKRGEVKNKDFQANTRALIALESLVECVKPQPPSAFVGSTPVCRAVMDCAEMYSFAKSYDKLHASEIKKTHKEQYYWWVGTVLINVLKQTK